MKAHLSTRRLGFYLLFAWLISPIPLVVFAIVFWSDLSISSIIATAIFVAPYAAATSWFGYRVITNYRINSIGKKLAFLIVPVLVICLFTYRNFVPHRIFLAEGEHDSPFDMIWYTWPQTSYGYPNPVWRIFDHELPVEPFGTQLLDISSIFLNLWMLFGALFVVFGIEGLFLVWTRKKEC